MVGGGDAWGPGEKRIGRWGPSLKARMAGGMGRHPRLGEGSACPTESAHDIGTGILPISLGPSDVPAVITSVGRPDRPHGLRIGQPPACCSASGRGPRPRRGRQHLPLPWLPLRQPHPGRNSAAVQSES